MRSARRSVNGLRRGRLWNIDESPQGLAHPLGLTARYHGVGLMQEPVQEADGGGVSVQEPDFAMPR